MLVYMLSRVYKRREREYLTSYCCVQTPFAKYRGQVTLSYTQTYHKRLAYNHALVLAGMIVL